jgi:hypothetical protein
LSVAEEPEVVLAEVSIYLHVQFAESQYQRLGRLTDETAREAALRYFTVPVRIEVDLGDGSVFGKIKVSGLLFTLAILGDIDGSIELAKKMYEATQAFAEVVTEHFISDAGASKDDVESVQVRANAPKHLVLVLKRIQKLENNTANLSPKEMQSELHKLRKQLERALPRVPRHEKLQVLEGLKFKNLPPFSQWPTRPPEEPLPTARAPELDIEDWDYGTERSKREAPPKVRIGSRRAAPKIRYRNAFFVEPNS